MATKDISRSAFYIEKDYADLGMQQGRVLTDADYNEARHITRENQRRTDVDVIGSCGSPDQGFYIDNATAVAGKKNSIDFDIFKGIFYIGGLRLELHSKETLQLQNINHKETFQLQKNWLQHTEEKEVASKNDIYLVYLEAWQQPVSAVEDSELFEAALGGPDTATRLRTMWRVKLYTVKNTQYDDCGKAWAELQKKWQEGGDGTLAASNELIPDTTLTVTFDSTGVSKDLCKPSVTGGYLGAENQAIRVQIVDDKHFTWGFDNGSPLYRVTVNTNATGKRTVVQMITEPKDTTHQPRAGQVVEFLPWSAVLVNGEKLAEEGKPGYFAKVQSDYATDKRTFSLTSVTALPSTYGESWKDRSDAKDLLKNPYDQQTLDEYLFMRVWDRGVGPTSDAKIPISNKAELGATGLQVTFNNNDRRPGDYWIIAARPETPNKVIPWQLEDKRPANGIRRFYTPLAVIKWNDASGGQLEGKIQDCRKTFRPLTELQTCCTCTVGDGVQSHGDFTDLQTAIDSLPTLGGEICLLPGKYTHKKTVILKDLNNVTIQGCGERSKLLAPQKDGPVIQIEDCQHIKISSLLIESTTGVGIDLKGKQVDQIEQQAAILKYILLTDLTIVARDNAAIVCGNGSFITLLDNHIRLEASEKIGLKPAVLLQADDLRFERNQIIADSSQGAPKTALGGLQIGGGSDRVVIRRNKIVAGNGNGITLGSVHYEGTGATDTSTPDLDHWRHTLSEDAAGCIRLIPHPPPRIGTGAGTRVLKSDGDLREVEIIDNIIQKMGGNGIGVVHFHDIDVDGLLIKDNEIRDCRQLALKGTLSQSSGYGGIVLAGGQYHVICNNIIENNGSSTADPTCGIFVLNAVAITIENNRILYNGGPRTRTGNNVRLVSGNRGGIVISNAKSKTEKVTVAGVTPRIKLTVARQDGVPAARIHGNIVVSPEGRALKLGAYGPVSVQGNQFTSHSSVSLDQNDPIDRLGGAVVAITNLGISNELYGGLLFGLFNALDKKSQSRPPSCNGNIQFNDNQVVFDVLDKSPSNVFSSILLMSLDDINMTANQSDCDLSAGDLMWTNTLVLGISVRVADNRFKEGLFLALASAATLGWLNTTTDNQGAHCFLTNGIDNASLTENNRVLSLTDLSAIIPGWKSRTECESLNEIWRGMTSSLIGK